MIFIADSILNIKTLVNTYSYISDDMTTTVRQ